jgi:hypothetical protein
MRIEGIWPLRSSEYVYVTPNPVRRVVSRGVKVSLSRFGVCFGVCFGVVGMRITYCLRLTLSMIFVTRMVIRGYTRLYALYALYAVITLCPLCPLCPLRSLCYLWRCYLLSGLIYEITLPTY